MMPKVMLKIITKMIHTSNYVLNMSKIMSKIKLVGKSKVIYS